MKLRILIAEIIIFALMATNGNAQHSLSETREARNDFHFGYGYGIPQALYTKRMADLGTSGIKFSGHIVLWDRVEKRPPKEEKHFYDWRFIDNIVKSFQNTPEDLFFVIKGASRWAGQSNDRKSKSWPPDDKYLNDYGRFVLHLVERYDGDGTDDMPGLRNPIKIWGIESEVHHSYQWGGSKEQYLDVLKTAYKNVKAADPSTLVVLAGINTGECLNADGVINQERPECRHPFSQKEISFIKDMLGACDSYDVIDFHANHGWEGIADTVNFIKNTLRENSCSDKPIWAGDMLNVSLIEHAYSRKEAKSIFDRLDSGDSKAMEWFRKKQQTDTAKKVISALGQGVQRIFLEIVTDHKKSNFPTWKHMGMLDDDATPRPVYTTYQLIVDKLSGFTQAEKISSAQGKYIYKFIVGAKPVYVMWGKGLIETRIEGEVTVTDIDGKAKKINAENLVLSEEPIFIESHESPRDM